MKVVALLSWYDEPASWLAECVASTAKLCDHIVAVDGAYALFPDALRKPISGAEQSDTIRRTAAAVGMGCTIHTPTGSWWGNEVEKRDFMIQVGQTVTEPGDWYLIVDADEVLVQAPADTRMLLDAADCDAADLILWERNPGDEDSRTPLRRLFRALPDLHIVQAHYVVVAGNRVLCGNSTVHDVEPAAMLPDVVLEHRPSRQSRHRQRQKQRFYRDRDDLGIETLSPIGEVIGAGG